MASLSTLSKFGRAQIDPTITELPTSPTVVTDTDTEIFQIFINNKSGGSVNITFQDGQGEAGNIVLSQAAPQGITLMVFPEGLFCKDGFIWSATAGDVVGSLKTWRTL